MSEHDDRDLARLRSQLGLPAKAYKHKPQPVAPGRLTSLEATPNGLAGAAKPGARTQVEMTEPHAIAARAVEGPDEPLPHLPAIQAAFGRHDVSRVRAHVGDGATEANHQLGAVAFAFGDRVAFASTPDLFTAAHEAAHVVQQRSGVAKQDDAEQEQLADRVASKVARGESAERLLDRVVGGGSAAPVVQFKKPGAGAQAGPADDFDGDYSIESGGNAARIHRRWLREQPAERWLDVLIAMQMAGAVPWAQPEALRRFARMLARKHPMQEDIVTFRLDAIALATIGLPVGAAPKVERLGDDLMIVVPGVGSTGNAEVLDLDADHNREVFEAVCRALEAFVGLRIAVKTKTLQLGAVGASTTTAVMRLHDGELATIFGEKAWSDWKHRKKAEKTSRKKPSRSDETREPTPGPTPEHVAPPADGNELDTDEQARVAAWFAKQGATPRHVDRTLFALVAEIEADPALAAAVRAQMQRASLERPVDAFALRAAIDRARVEMERTRLGLGAFRRDRTVEAFMGRLGETDPLETANVPARLVQQGLLLSGRPAHFDLALDWGAYRGSTDDDFANRDWHAVVEWVVERADTQGPAAPGGGPIAPAERFQTEHKGNAIGIDHTFRLGPHEASGIWTVHAFLHTSHFAPKHVTATVEVKTESARMSDLRREAFAGMEPSRAQAAPHRFDIGTGNTALKAIDLHGAGNDADADGVITRGELPEEFHARSAEERASSREDEIERTEELIEYLSHVGDTRYADALDAARRRLERLRRADADVKSDEARGWESFEIRGTYLSRQPEVPSGALDLYGSVRRERIRTPLGDVDRVLVHIRDHSQKLGPDLTMYSGVGATFEAALEQAFVTLCKEYPEGKVSVMAQVMDASRGKPAATRQAIGFELATTSPWKRVKDKVYNPVVQTVVNVAATALMIFQPELAPFIMPLLTVQNTVANVDELVRRYENHTLKAGFVGISLAQIGLDFMPYLRGARILQTESRLVAFEAVNMVGMGVVMALHTREAIAQIQEGDIAALAEEYREMIELQKTTNPSDPELSRRQRAIETGAERIRQRVMEEWSKAVGENGIFLVGSHVLADTQRRIVGGNDRAWAPGHLDAVGPEYQHTSKPESLGVNHRDEAASRSAKPHRDAEHTSGSRQSASSKEMLVEDLAAKKALAEQHAHADGSVPVESVLAEPANLSIPERASQISDLKKIIDEVAEEATKAKAAGKEPREPEIQDLRPQERTEKDGEVAAAAKVLMVSLEDALKQEKGLVNRLYEAKLRLQQEKLKTQPDPKRVAVWAEAVDAALLEYRQHLVMRKPDYARYATDVQTGLEFFRRYKMITGHNLTPREIADTRASAGQLAAQELRVGIGGDAMKDIAALKELATEFNSANDEAAWFGDKTDVSLIVNTTKKKSGSPEHAEDMATLIDEWAKDPRLQRAVSGLDNAGVESAKLPPSKLWKMSAKRAFMNAETIRGELSRVPASQRDALIESLSRVLGGDKSTARATLERFEVANFKAAMAAVDAKQAGAAVDVDDHGTVTEAFAGMTMEDAARTTREITSALRAHRAETGDTQQLPRLLGYTVHAGEQLKDMDPFELLRQVEEAISLGADRIGHGLILGIDAKQLHKMGRLPEGRVDEFIARQEQVRAHAKRAGVTIEMNITSNTEISNLTSNEHPTAAMVKSGLRVSVSTDDETTLGTTVKDELRRLAAVPSTSRTDVAIVILEGFYSRMGVRELADRARLKAEYKQTLMQGLRANEVQDLAGALAARFHTSIVAGNPEATIQRVLDAIFGTGG